MMRSRRLLRQVSVREMLGNLHLDEPDSAAICMLTEYGPNLHLCHYIKYPSLNQWKIDISKKQGVESLGNEISVCENIAWRLKLECLLFHLDYKLREFTSILRRKEGKRGKPLEQGCPKL